MSIDLNIELPNEASVKLTQFVLIMWREMNYPLQAILQASLLRLGSDDPQALTAIKSFIHVPPGFTDFHWLAELKMCWANLSSYISLPSMILLDICSDLRPADYELDKVAAVGSFVSLLVVPLQLWLLLQGFQHRPIKDWNDWYLS